MSYSFESIIIDPLEVFRLMRAPLPAPIVPDSSWPETNPADDKIGNADFIVPI